MYIEVHGAIRGRRASRKSPASSLGVTHGGGAAVGSDIVTGKHVAEADLFTVNMLLTVRMGDEYLHAAIHTNIDVKRLIAQASFMRLFKKVTELSGSACCCLPRSRRQISAARRLVNKKYHE